MDKDTQSYKLSDYSNAGEGSSKDREREEKQGLLSGSISTITQEVTVPDADTQISSRYLIAPISSSSLSFPFTSILSLHPGPGSECSDV
jgi:hypothetical protein